jgi:hypothetical protein
MGKICILKIPNAERDLPEQSRRKPESHPVGLLAFLQAENLRLHNVVAQLKRDTAASREATQSR